MISVLISDGLGRYDSFIQLFKYIYLDIDLDVCFDCLIYLLQLQFLFFVGVNNSIIKNKNVSF